MAIENAGATRGYLIVHESGDLVIGAARDANERDVVAPGTALSDCPEIPEPVARFVDRTGEPVVVTDASTDPRWVGTPGMEADRPTSILCAPIVHQDVTGGIVYLVNDLVDGAFTPACIRGARVALSASRHLDRERALHRRAADASRSPRAACERSDP